jgi:CxxC motif-containing protein
MTAITHYLCIGCPLGCRLEVEEDGGEIVEVRGFACKRGKEYAEREHIDPRRIVTTTIGVRNGLWARLPVKTNKPVPKAMVLAICQSLGEVIITAPVKLGQLIWPNILDSGVDVVATRDMPRK